MDSLEKRYVWNTYKKIAENFSSTRAYLWGSVDKYMKQIPAHSVVLEVGCGNGKNLDLPKRRDLCLMGCDFTPEFCNITSEKGLECTTANVLALPYRSASVDYLLCIAVIHHLSTEERRVESIREMLRVLRPKGRLLLQVWALEQPAKSRNTFTQADNLVPWRNSAHTMHEQRFYHVFKEGELERLVTLAGGSIVSSCYEVGNWVVELVR